MPSTGSTFRKLAGSVAAAAIALGAAGCGAHSRAGGSATSRTPPSVSASPRLGPCSTRVAGAPVLSAVRRRMVPFAGFPFGVATSSDGRWAFVSGFSTTAAGLEVLDVRAVPPRRVRTIPLPGSRMAAGVTLTPDGRYALVAQGSGAAVVSTTRAERGAPHPVLGLLKATPAAPSPRRASAGGGGGAAPLLYGSAIETLTSPDGRYVFVSDEYADAIAVFDLARALAHGFGAGDYVGSIPLGHAVVGMALSPDGRTLYATSELRAGRFAPGAYGTLSVVDVDRAERTPADSVVSTVPAGCGAVRVVASPDGATVWVTARESDELLAFSAAKLRTAPGASLVAAVRVGEAPVGLVVLEGGRRIVVADSNRFERPGAASGLTVVDVRAALAGAPSVLGTIPAGRFPRELAADVDAGVLLVTNFQSGEVETVRLGDLP